jgi:prepilin-type N-terminal cleavage/methylation domain-containing protein
VSRRSLPAAADRGFTLIELMIVIAIIAIIAAIAIPNLLAAKLSANETAAIATLRSLVSAQAQIGVAGKIDCDSDGRGEYGTMMEMTGSIGTRRGYNPGPPATSDFSVFGPVLNPPVLSSVMARIDSLGFATKSGYAFMIFLPDNNDPSLFCHETGPTTSPNLSARIEVDLAETYWCAYAQPVSRGNSGNRRFFTSMRGDVVQSANDVAKAHGTTAVIQGNSAFLGDGITSLPATGTAGKDGDVWKVTN